MSVQPQQIRNNALVTPKWLERRLNTVTSDTPDLRLIEVDLNTDFYAESHIPGAVSIDWRQHLQHRTRRDIPSKEALSDLLGTRGIADESTLVLYCRIGE